jgi:hypothetical protein
VSCEQSRCLRVCRSGTADCNHDLDLGFQGDGCETEGKCPSPSSLGTDARPKSGASAEVDSGVAGEGSCAPDPVGATDDVVYLCDCESSGGSGHSEMDYYSKFTCVKRLARPEDTAVVSPGTKTIPWEGRPVKAVFRSGVAFEAMIERPNGAPQAERGTGTNGPAQFKCSQGSGQELYQSDAWSCRDVYVCRRDPHS